MDVAHVAHVAYLCGLFTPPRYSHSASGRRYTVGGIGPDPLAAAVESRGPSSILE